MRDVFRMAPEGIAPVGLCMLLAALLWSALRGPYYLVPLSLGLFLAYFFRDPERRPCGEGVLSPADGRVVEVGRVLDDFVGDAHRVGIFMSPFDVHVNRSPVEGKVVGVRYVPGKRAVAFAPKASEVNERNYVMIEGPLGRFKVCQIAGLLARRIVCYVGEGSSLSRGQRIGIIKLGSRVDLYMPSCYLPLVKVGDRVKAGSSVIGVMSHEEREKG